MPKGISIHVGLNDVDPTKFKGPLDSLKGCEHDARDMRDIAESRGFAAQLLLGPEATTVNVINAIGAASLELKGGEILLFTFSGHGSQVLDPINGDEPDSQDERMVLFDACLLDDQLYALWTKFRAGVRILFIPDSCHSGTLMMVPGDPPEPAADQPGKAAAPDDGDEGFFPEAQPVPDEDGQPRLVRSLPRSVMHRHDSEFLDFYNSVRHVLPPTANSKNAVVASLIQISACQEFEKALDGSRNGVFTSMLREVWADGAFQGTYGQFYEAILKKTVPFKQRPNFRTLGVTNAAFEDQRPFTI